MKPRRNSRAAKADRHTLYQRSVQDVESEIDFIDATYLALRGRYATRLREDFCGTFNSSCEWVRRRTANRAIGVDLCAETLKWGIANNLDRLSSGQRKRVDLVNGDVRTTAGRPHNNDVVLAMNFSYWCFLTRPAMLRYFRSVHRTLRDDGVFFLDFYGGADSLKECRERRPCRGFTYVWDQRKYNPINGHMECRIHFTFPDGSRLPDAFTYHWRVWGLPELREALEDAGFERVTVYWEGDDGKGGGDGDFQPATEGENCPAYITYIVAEKKALALPARRVRR